MTHTHAVTPVLRPFGLIGRYILDVVRYLGGMGLLVISVARSIVRPAGNPPRLGQAVARQLDTIFRFGLPLVAIMHVGLGSFLAMQAYFGATFYDGIGPVVGVGLVRNIAPLMSAMVLAGLLGAKYTSELRAADRDALDHDPRWLPDRDSSTAGPDVRPPIEPARLAASRMIAAILAGPVMGIWGALVGIAVGFGVASTLLKVTTPGFFDLFLQMLWLRDIVGIVLKGMAFGMAASWFACYEGLRRPLGVIPDPAATPGVAVRVACLAGVAILVLNSAWFLLFYHAGPAFGPTFLAPPLS
jgi:phospholipid/cholesterol/gamma-HCH transport system permease protein